MFTLGHTRTVRAAFVLCLSVAAACDDQSSEPSRLTAPAAPSLAKGGQNQPPTSNGKIYFSSFITGNYEIFSINPDGTDLRRLTFTPDDERWIGGVSPDGKKILYLRANGAQHDIWTMNVDGSQARLRLAEPDFVDNMHRAVWSPDGRTITFSYSELGTGKLRVANIGATNGAPIVLSIEGTNASWSPDGQYLAYAKLIPGDGFELATSRPDGSDFVQRTTDLDTCCSAPNWSPDGTRILVRDISGSTPVFRLVGVTIGSGAFSMSDPPSAYGAWSPDGTKIVYYSGGGALRVVLANGTDLGVILQGAQAVGGVAWSR